MVHTAGSRLRLGMTQCQLPKSSAGRAVRRQPRAPHTAECQASVETGLSSITCNRTRACRRFRETCPYWFKRRASPGDAPCAAAVLAPLRAASAPVASARRAWVAQLLTPMGSTRLAETTPMKGPGRRSANLFVLAT